MTNVVDIKAKPTVTLTIEVTAETQRLMGKFLALNQHSNNTHGPMTVEKLAAMLLEDVGLAVRDNKTWEGGHMHLVLSAHGYRT